MLTAMSHSWAMELQLRQSIRALLRRPAFAVTAVLTLGLGLAASTALTAVVDEVLLRPLPHPDANRLVSVTSALAGPNGQPQQYLLSFPEFVRARANARTLSHLEGLLSIEMALTTDDEPITVR